MAGVATRTSSAATRPPARRFQQRLTHDAFEDERELRADLRLLARRKRVDQPRDRLRRRVRVQRRQRQMPRLRHRQGSFHGFEVAQLADEDHVRVRSKGGTKGFGKAPGIGPQLSLVDETRSVRVDVLDGVLDRQNVGRPRSVHPIHHRRHRCRLAGAGGTGDEHQTARPIGKPANRSRKAEFLERPDRLWNQAEDRADDAPLAEHVAATAANAIDGESPIDLVPIVEHPSLAVVQRAVSKTLRVFRRQRWEIETMEIAIHTHSGRGADRKVQVGTAEIERGPEQFVKRHIVSFTSSSMVVSPERTFCRPLSRSDCMPSAAARRRSSGTGALDRTRSRSGSVISITSNTPTRPR